MLEDLKKELLNFIKDVNNNVKNEEDRIYISNRTNKLVDGILRETEKIVNYKDDEISSIIDVQKNQNIRLEELQEKVDNLCADVYDEDIDDEFDISCPYCGAEFGALIDENIDEIICPECSNHIELDWSGEIDGEEFNHGCSGGCSHCGGCDK